jgi:hypothetical protein
VYVFANRVESWLFGLPDLYACLLFIGCALIAVLV